MNKTLFANDLVLQVRRLEKVLHNHPSVQDAVVVPHDMQGDEQKIKAFIEPADPPPPVEVIMEYCKKNFGHIQVPMDIIFREIPRTASGKVIRQQLMQT